MRSLDDQIGELQEKIAQLNAKEHTYKNRRLKLGQKLKGLLKRRKKRQDELFLVALARQIKTDPEQERRLHETLDTLDLNDEDRVIAGLEPKNAGGTAPGAPGSGRQTRGTAPLPAANGTRGLDAPTAPSPDGPATAPPDSTSATADGKPASPAGPVDNDATPSQPKAPSDEARLPEESGPEPPTAQDPGGTPAASPDPAAGTGDDKPASAAGQNTSADAGEKPTEKQLKYLKDLIVKFPDRAKQIGIDLESLSSISKQKASWAIQQLTSPPTSPPRSRSRR